jgi:hypothetical protein
MIIVLFIGLDVVDRFPVRMAPRQKVPASVPVHYSDLPIDALEIDMSLAVGGYAVDRERVMTAE